MRKDCDVSNQTTLSGKQLESWTNLVTKGILNSISGLSDMLGQVVIVTSLNARTMPIKDTADLFGGPEAPTAAVYLSILGVAQGHMVLVYQPKTAFEFIDMLLGEPPGTTHELGPMEESALAEMGNLVGSFFLNAMADATSLDLRVSPPVVMMDMAGAILDPILAEALMEADDALVVDTTFGTKDRQINGSFLVLPSPELQSVLLGRWTE